MKKNKMKEASPVEETKTPKKGSLLKSLAFAGKVVTALLVVLVLFWFGFVCEVREGDCAVILRFGAVRRETKEAGVYLKLPWPFETVVTYDNRVQYLESGKLETITKDNRNVMIQSYVVWQIDDPELYHNSVGVQGAVDNYINEAVKSATNGTLGGYNLNELVSSDAENLKIGKIQEDIFLRVQEVCAKNYGVKITDVSILRLSLPDENLSAAFDYMKTERNQEIERILAEAQNKASEITLSAAEQSAKIIAEGTEKAAEIKKETETQVAKIYADAQAANLELYQFLMSLDTYLNSVDETTILVVKADEYPFNILTQYSQQMVVDSNDMVITDLTYILSQLPEEERQALVDAITELIAQSARQNGVDVGVDPNAGAETGSDAEVDPAQGAE